MEGKSTVGLYEGQQGKLEAEVLGDYVRAKLDQGGNVPRIPPYHIGVGLNWSRANLDAGVLAKYSAAQTDVATAETPTGGFVSLDAQLGWHSLWNQPGLNVALIGRNLTNTTHRNAVAINKDAVILPGRDVRVVVRLAF